MVDKWVSGSAEDFAEVLGMTVAERERGEAFHAREGRWPTVVEIVRVRLNEAAWERERREDSEDAPD